MRQFVFLLAMASAGVALATPRTDQNAPWNVNFNPDGIPLFYYGDEQGFSSQGTALDGWSREDFMTSKPWFTVPDHS